MPPATDTHWLHRIIDAPVVGDIAARVGKTGRAVARGVWGSSTTLLTGALACHMRQTTLLVVAHLDDADDAIEDLQLFAAAGMSLYPDVKKVITAYVWCDHPNAPPLAVEYERKDLGKLWREFGDRAELIQLALESGVWEAKPSPFNCKYCEALPSQCKFKSEYS